MLHKLLIMLAALFFPLFGQTVLTKEKFSEKKGQYIAQVNKYDLVIEGRLKSLKPVSEGKQTGEFAALDCYKGNVDRFCSSEVITTVNIEFKEEQFPDLKKASGTAKIFIVFAKKKGRSNNLELKEIYDVSDWIKNNFDFELEVLHNLK